MKIIVSVKQVPARDSNLRVDGSGKRLDDSDLNFEINEPDAYALEEALQLKDKLGGEVIVLCAGPERASQTIREALAKGADRAIHVQVDEPGTLDALVTARLLAKAIESESPDLVLTGLQSDDLGYGQTGVIVAELLGMATQLSSWKWSRKEMESASNANSKMAGSSICGYPLPALLTIQSGIKKLRYATLMGIKKAKTKEVKVLPAGELRLRPGAVYSYGTGLFAAASETNSVAERQRQRDSGTTG